MTNRRSLRPDQDKTIIPAIAVAFNDRRAKLANEMRP